MHTEAYLKPYSYIVYLGRVSRNKMSNLYILLESSKGFTLPVS